MRLTAILAFLGITALQLAPRPAAATEITLVNHKFVPMGGDQMVRIQGQFAKGEAIGETFSPPAAYYPFRIIGAQFLAVGNNGASGGTAKLTFTVHKDGGSVKPGEVLLTHTQKDPTEGNTMFLQTEDFADTPTVDSGNLRLVITTDTNTVPSGVTFAEDPKTSAATSSLCVVPGAPCTWLKATDAGVTNAWIVGLTIDTMKTVDVPDGGGNGGGDGGTNPTGAPSVESITPDSLPEGQGGAALIRGNNFAVNGTTVTLDGKGGPVPLTGILVEDSKTVKVQIPTALPMGIYGIVVQTSKGTGKLANGLVITEAQKSGCSASHTGAPLGVPALLLMLVPLVLVRRRARA